MELANKKILLTGAAGGLGAELAPMLARRGAVLAMVGRDPYKLSLLQQAIRAEGGEAFFIVADLAQPGMAAQVLKQANAVLGDVDILINNAGMIDFTAIETQPDEKIDMLVSTNVTATLQLTRGFIAQALPRNHGHVLFVGSIFGSLGFPHFATYCASKFAVHGFSQALRRELVDTQIGVTYIAPRAIATPMNDARAMAMWQAAGQTVDAPRKVAIKVLEALLREKKEVFIGQPQRFFAWLNGVLPRLVDQGLRQQARLAKKFL